jgi:hypothetical protein
MSSNLSGIEDGKNIRRCVKRIEELLTYIQVLIGIAVALV